MGNEINKTEIIGISLETFMELQKAKEQLAIIIRTAEKQKYSLEREQIENICGIKLKPYAEED